MKKSTKNANLFSLDSMPRKKGKSKDEVYGKIESYLHPNGDMTMYVKPLSVNKAWKGKRFKTTSYKNYEKALLFSLPPYPIPKGFLSIRFCFGFSSILSDFDNPVKLITDILQKKYKFNDKLIRHCVIQVYIVEKGNEYFNFNISPYVNQ